MAFGFQVSDETRAELVTMGDIVLKKGLKENVQLPDSVRHGLWFKVSKTLVEKIVADRKPIT